MGDDVEPAPLVPGKSERLCIQSRCNPWQAPRLLSAGACFGPSKRSLSRPVPLPSPRVRDFSPPPPTEYSASPDDRESEGEEEEVDLAADTEAHALHKAVWLANLPRIRALLEAGTGVNQTDAHGATPLMLAVELRPRAGEYEGVIRHLLQAEADPRLRSGQGWSPLDEAVSRGDKELVRLLFESTQAKLRERWDKRLSLMSSSLALLPDFECRIKWEFESPVLPLVNRLAPSDVVRLRKRGTSLRVDSTLASWKRFRLSKRRELSTLFRGETGAAAAPSNGVPPSLSMLNHSKRTVVDVTEGLDPEESGAVLGDLVSADVVQWDMKLDKLEVAEATTWLGGIAPPCDVNGWRALRFDVHGTFGVSVKKKGRRRNEMTFQEYFGCSLPPDACLPELREEFKVDFSPGGLVREASRTTDASGETLEYEATFDLFDRGFERGPPPGISRDLDTASDASEVLVQWPDAASPRSFLSGVPGAGDSVAGSGTRSFGKLQPSVSSGGSQASGRFASLAAAAGRGRRGASLPGMGDRAGKTTRSISASVWLATDFAISLQQFLPVLDALAVEHEAMRRLRDLLSSESIKSAVERTQRAIAVAETGPRGTDGTSGSHVFPVRASVPINIAVRALVHFEAFTLQPAGSLPAELFEVPRDYHRVSRAEAQKTPNRAKKRTLLANLTL